MFHKKVLLSISLAVTLCFAAGFAWSGSASSENYNMIRDTFSAGGLTGTSASYQLVSSLGQPGAVGKSSGSAYRIDAGFLASPLVTTYDLTVTLAGGGSGTVTSDLPGIDCGSSCTRAYEEGTVVELTAAAGPDSIFTGWSNGPCSGTGACQVTMDANIAVTATFAGPPIITTHPHTQSAWTGQSVTFIAAAQGDGTLSYQWQKDGSDISGATSPQYTISTVALADAGGYTCIVSNFVGDTPTDTAGLTVYETVHITGQPTSQTVVLGDPVTFSVTAMGTAPISYQWKKDGSNLSGENSADLTIAAATLADEGSYTCTVTNGGGNATSDPAVLTVRNIFTITAGAGPNGSIDPDGLVNVIEGDNQSFIVTPASHYNIDQILVDGSPVTLPSLPAGTPYTHTFTNVTQNHTINASFTIEQVTLTISTAGAGQGTTDPSVGQYQYDYGTDVSIEAFPATGSVFSGWSGDAAGTVNPVMITMSGSKNITANFSENPHVGPRATIKNPPFHLTNRTHYRIDVGGICVAAYKWKLDNGTYGPPTPVTTPLDVTVTTEGLHTLYVIGGCASGNWQSESAPTTHSWTIDLTPPTATLSHLPGSTTGNPSINIRVSGDNVRCYRYRLDNGTNPAYENFTNCYSVDRPIQVTGLGAGNHHLDVIAEDRAGNWQVVGQATPFDWIVDPNIPTAVLSNLPDLVTRENHIDVQVAGVAGGVLIDGYKYALDQGAWVYGPFGSNIVIHGLQDGTHTLYVNAHGENGIWQDGDQGTSRSLASTYEWEVDRTSPDRPVLTATPGDPASTSAQLSWPSVENNQTKYVLRYSYLQGKGTKNLTIDLFYTPGPSGTLENYLLTGLAPNQTYQFRIQSVDAAGNYSQWSHPVILTTSDQCPVIDNFALTADLSRAGTNDQARELRITGLNINNQSPYCLVRFLNDTRSFDMLSTGSDTAGIWVDVPKGAPVGVYHLKVINQNGVSPLSAQTYEVLVSMPPLPEVHQVSPAAAENNQDVQAVIRGRHFTDAFSLNLLPTRESQIVDLTNFQVVDDSTIHSVVPAGIAEDLYQIRVETDAGANQVSAARYDAQEPVDLTGLDTPVITTHPAQMPGDGVIPVNLILSTDTRAEAPQDNATNLEITANFETGTEITGENDQPYTGIVHPPRQVPVDNLPEDLDGTILAFTMGADQRLTLGDGQTITVLLDIVLPGSQTDPVVYYVEANGDVTLAGIEGVKDGVHYQVGGSLFNIRFNSPEAGFTTFTMGVLLDHMSTLAVAAQEQPAPTIIAINPFVVSTTGGTDVTVTGANFLDGANLFIDGEDTPYTLVDAQTITFTSPPHAQGSVDVTVTNPDDQSATLEDGFFYVKGGHHGGGGGGCFIGTLP